MPILRMHTIMNAIPRLEYYRREEMPGREMEQEAEWEAEGGQGNMHR